MRKLNRDSIYISNLVWCLIQTVVLILGVILFLYLGALIASVTGFLDCIFISVMIWFILFYILKFIVEEKFSDYIETD